MNPTCEARDPTRRRAMMCCGTWLYGAWLLTGPVAAAADDNEAAAWQALRAGAIVLFRHAQAPGVGDPAQFRIGDCNTQRNLDATGRAQSQRIGARLRAQGVTVGKVLASQWCRTMETAELAFPGRATPEPVFNSFFQDRDNAPEQTAAARALLLQWKGPGALVVVSHQVNISGLTSHFTASGEGIVLRPAGGQLEFVGRILP
jgi:phosphohistidine phosphatase SixA